MEWAQEANDIAMQGYVLLRKSQMAYDNRDAHRVVTFAEAALPGSLEAFRTGCARRGRAAACHGPRHDRQRTSAWSRNTWVRPGRLLARAPRETGESALGGCASSPWTRCYCGRRPVTPKPASPPRAARLFGPGAGRRHLVKAGRRLLQRTAGGRPGAVRRAGRGCGAASRAGHRAPETSSERTMRLLGDVARALAPLE